MRVQEVTGVWADSRPAIPVIRGKPRRLKMFFVPSAHYITPQDERMITINGGFLPPAWATRLAGAKRLVPPHERAGEVCA